MRKGRLFIVFIAAGWLMIAACSNDDAKKRTSQTERDTTALTNPVPSDTTDFDSCYEKFFAGLPRFKDSLSAFLFLDNGKRQSLTQFFRDEFMSPVSQYGKKDIDGDGVEELIVFNYTGGAHCCDEYFIFTQRNEQEYDYKAHIMGGLACIDPVSNLISYSFSETLGYFFSCYACGVSDTTGGFKTMREIQLKFSAGSLQVVQYDSITAKQNVANLEILKKHGFEKIVAMMDNGWRKEYAINLAIWHYNHGKSWKATKKMFDKYYIFSDARKVWQEFYRTITEAGKENSF